MEIGLTEFTLDVPALPERELRAYSIHLFDKWDDQLGQHLPLSDYALRLEIEEGSLKGRGRIAATAFSIFTAVSAAGGFIAGTKEITWAVKSAGTLLAREAAAPYAVSQPKLRVRRATGKLGEMERLIQRVQNGQLDRREAAILAQELFAEEEDEAGMQELTAAAVDTVTSVPRAPTQLVLPLEEFEDLIISGAPKRNPATQRSPRPKPVVPPLERFRAEVWRETRKGRKRIQITPL